MSLSTPAAAIGDADKTDYRIQGVRYPGGKNSGGAYQKIICQMPRHRVYIEPFLGSGAVMRHKQPAQTNIGIDKDLAIVDRFDCWRRQLQSGNASEYYEVINGCGISFLESYQWQGDEFVYCDPPYLLETRRQRSPIYLHELSREDHERLLAVIKRVPAPVAISGYASSLYARELAGWRWITWQVMTRGGKLATEYLWMNYQEPVELHDYRYLGENRTDRQRIKRKKQRWVKRLEKMPGSERYAILAAIDQIRKG
jgi:DNA adenine methylase